MPSNSSPASDYPSTSAIPMDQGSGPEQQEGSQYWHFPIPSSSTAISPSALSLSRPSNPIATSRPAGLIDRERRRNGPDGQLVALPTSESEHANVSPPSASASFLDDLSKPPTLPAFNFPISPLQSTSDDSLQREECQYCRGDGSVRPREGGQCCDMQCRNGGFTQLDQESGRNQGMHPTPLQASPATGSSSTWSRSPPPAPPSSHIRECSFLQPGCVFKGLQSFHTTLSDTASSNNTRPSHAYSSSGYSTSWLDIPRPRNISGHPGENTPQAASWTDESSPYAAFLREMPSWQQVENSMIPPEMQSFIGNDGHAGVGARLHMHESVKSAAKEEWEVNVAISDVDYERGRVKGIMLALNVPNSSSDAPERTSNTVTTSFDGEIIDLRNNNLWTRHPPPSDPSDSSRYRTEDFGAPPAIHWLASAGLVDKTTDLDYWARVEAFSSYGSSAEKEICRIAREGRWTPLSRKWMQDPEDWLLMRWKERDFLDCEAKTSGLTISGFYYICLNRLTGKLTGFYYDPLSTPHQRLELHSARTNLPHGPSRGGQWFSSYDLL